MDSASSACFPQESQVFITGRLAARQPLGGRAEPQGRGSSDVRAAENAEEIGDAPDVHRHFFRGFPEVRVRWTAAPAGPARRRGRNAWEPGTTVSYRAPRTLAIRSRRC